MDGFGPRRRGAASRSALPLLLAGSMAAGCGDGPADPPAGESFEPDTAGLELVVDGLDRALDVAVEPAGGRLLIVEQNGLLRMATDGALAATPVLDLSGVVYAAGTVVGLMQIVLEPTYDATGRFFLSWVGADGLLHVERYALAPGAETVDPATAVPVISVAMPQPGAVGGALALDAEGLLYVGVGDGGTPTSADSAQDLGNLLGSILRLDVSGSDGYTVPPDNPYVGHATARPEIWAHGVHDPRGLAVDEESGLLYVLDSGSEWREVSVQPVTAGGADYGWPALDGTRCFRPPSGCIDEGRVAPVHEYGPNTLNVPRPGAVYRGAAVPRLVGHYIWADSWTGWVRSFELAGVEATERTEWILPLRPARWARIRAGPDGELLFVWGPAIYRLVAGA